MIKYFLLLFPLMYVSNMVKAQEVDSLINVGPYRLHFHIIKGKNTPILFEAGGGNDGTIWNDLAKPIAEITGATVISYDRPGLGKSGIDSTDTSIENDMKGLETGLAKLGYQKEIMLVSHSLGGFYNTLFAARHPKDVKSIVFIDANLPGFFTAEQFEKMNASQSFRTTVETIKRNPLPDHIPVLDVVSERTLFEGTPDADRWKAVHADFAAASANRKELIAYATGHYVFLQNKPLAINCIVTMYANYVMPARKVVILEKAYTQALTADNENRKSLMHYWHSEGDLNEWAYSFLQKNELGKALEIRRLQSCSNFAKLSRSGKGGKRTGRCFSAACCKPE